MKTTIRKLTSLLLVLALCLSFTVCVCGWQVNEASSLKFGDDGKFTILQFADTQDGMFTRKAMTMLMREAIKREKPDLIVLTGDNTYASATKVDSKIAIVSALKPITESGIPFTMVFGNHDAENVAKEYQLGVYQSFDNCLAVDAAPEIYGCGTHNLEIASSDGSKTAFNLWLIDSNMYDGDNGYDYVRQDQLDWYKSVSSELKAKNGGESVPSLAFQHICVPEIYETLLDADNNIEITRTYNGVKKQMKLKPDMVKGDKNYLNEWPCPPNTNGGEFDAFVETGDVLGIVTGHDHINSFVTTYKGIDFIQTQGIGFSTYGNELRGYRVITLDERSTGTYETYTKTFFDIYGNDTTAKFMYDYYGGQLSFFIPGFIGKIMTGFVSTDWGGRIYTAFASVRDKVSAWFDKI